MEHGDGCPYPHCPAEQNMKILKERERLLDERHDQICKSLESIQVNQKDAIEVSKEVVQLLTNVKHLEADVQDAKKSLDILWQDSKKNFDAIGKRVNSLEIKLAPLADIKDQRKSDLAWLWDFSKFVLSAAIGAGAIKFIG